MFKKLKEKLEEKKKLKIKIKKLQKECNEFNAMSKEDKMVYSLFWNNYLFKLKCISSMTGCGDDYANYEFYDESEGEEPYEGLKISLNWPDEGTLIISNEKVLELMEEFKGRFLEDNPDKKEEVEKYIEDFKNNAKLK